KALERRLLRAARSGRSLRIKLDYQVLVDVRQHVLARRHRLEHAAKFLVADRERTLDAQLLARLLADLDHIAGAALIGRYVDDLSVDADSLVADQLAGLGTRGRETHAIDHIVQTALEQLQQRLAGGSGAARGRMVIVAELTLEHAVHAAQLLLLSQLQTVIRQSLPPLTLDAARGHLQLALALERLGAALEKQIRALAAGELAGRTNVSRHDYVFLRRP